MMDSNLARALAWLDPVLDDWCEGWSVRSRQEFAEALAQALLRATKDAMIDGLSKYAWWKDGVQYVGTCGTTLRDAVQHVEREFRGAALSAPAADVPAPPEKGRGSDP